MPASPRARPWKLLLIGLLTLFVLSGAVLYLLVQQEAARWPSLVETTRVQAPTRPARGSGHAWGRFAQAIERLPATPPSLSADLEVEGRPSERALGSWLAFERHIDLLRAAVQETDGLVVPQPVRVDDPGPVLIPYLTTARAWLLSAWSEALAGEPALALTDMLVVQTLGLRFMEGDSGYVGTMFGVIIERLARREVRELLQVFGVDHPQLYDLAASGLRVPEPGFAARALAAEANTLEGYLVASTAPTETFVAWGYDEDLTRVWLRQRMQALVDRAALPRAERPTSDLPTPWATSNSWAGSLLNHSGRILLELAASDYSEIPTREDAAVAGARLELLFVAVRRYALAREGAFPSSQDELVPELLAAPLLDPFDGQPLRLDATAVWSVGEGVAPSGEPLRLTL